MKNTPKVISLVMKTRKNHRVSLSNNQSKIQNDTCIVSSVFFAHWLINQILRDLYRFQTLCPLSERHLLKGRKVETIHSAITTNNRHPCTLLTIQIRFWCFQEDDLIVVKKFLFNQIHQQWWVRNNYRRLVEHWSFVIHLYDFLFCHMLTVQQI